MTSTYNVSYLRGEIVRIIATTISIRRGSLMVSGAAGVESSEAPPTDVELDEFLLQCPLEKQELADVLLGDELASVKLSPEELAQFLEDVEGWSQNNTWLGGDEWLPKPTGRA